MNILKRFSLTKKQLFNSYGCNYSKLDLFLTSLMMCICIGVVGYIHKLQTMYFILLMGTVILLLPIIFTSYFKYKYERNKFEEYCLYFENMKLYFKTYKKLIIALEETEKLFSSNSKMKECISKAIKEIKSSGDYEKALSNIDEHYHNSYLMRLHNLLITGEKQGSDAVYYNLDLINYEDWKIDMKQFQSRKKSAKYIFYIIFLMGLGISLYTVYVFTIDEMFAKITDTLSYQIYTFIELETLLVFFIYLYIQLVNKKWIRSDE